MYLVHLLSRINIIRNPKVLAKSHYRTLFAPLYDENSLFIQQSTFTCYHDSMSETVQQVLYKINVNYFTQITKFIADCINDPILSKGIKLLWLENYVEVVARWAMGNVDDVVFFIRECLEFDQKLEVCVCMYAYHYLCYFDFNCCMNRYLMMLKDLK